MKRSSFVGVLRGVTVGHGAALTEAAELPEHSFLVGRADRASAALYHLSALCWLVVPFGHFIGPLLAWPHARGNTQFARSHLQEVLLFQGWAVIYFLIAYLVTGLNRTIRARAIGRVANSVRFMGQHCSTTWPGILLPYGTAPPSWRSRNSPVLSRYPRELWIRQCEYPQRGAV